MKTFKHYLKVVIASIIFNIVLLIPGVNVCFFFYVSKNTIDKWTSHKDIFWCNTDNIKITISDGKENITIFEGKLIDLEFDFSKKSKVIRNTEIKYVRLAENNTLEVRLWNERKINKLLGITTTQRKWE